MSLWAVPLVSEPVPPIPPEQESSIRKSIISYSFFSSLHLDAKIQRKNENQFLFLKIIRQLLGTIKKIM
jgi:hypothetical protein